MLEPFWTWFWSPVNTPVGILLILLVMDSKEAWKIVRKVSKKFSEQFSK